uniref:Probable Rho GTPase-activating protein CG5521 n=1 Tax=Culex pipiens TaxID=7175 RepID=A0A8D8AR05_CULPI
MKVNGFLLNTAGLSPLRPHQENQTSIILNQRALETERRRCGTSRRIPSLLFRWFRWVQVLQRRQRSPGHVWSSEPLAASKHNTSSRRPGRLGTTQADASAAANRQTAPRAAQLGQPKVSRNAQKAVIYVTNGQEDKNWMIASALGWDVELESYNGFLGGCPR